MPAIQLVLFYKFSQRSVVELDLEQPHEPQLQRKKQAVEPVMDAQRQYLYFFTSKASKLSTTPTLAIATLSRARGL